MIILINSRDLKDKALEFVNTVLGELLSELRTSDKEAIQIALKLAKMYYYWEAKRVLKQEFSKAEAELLKAIEPHFKKLSRKTKEKLIQIMRWD